jgi:hypothetical protein
MGQLKGTHQPWDSQLEWTSVGGQVSFANDRCYIDGQEAGLPQVEERAAVVQHRVAARQPWLVIITVVVVLLAGMGYVEKLMLLLSASREARGMGGWLRDLVERYRAHRLRYFRTGRRQRGPTGHSWHLLHLSGRGQAIQRESARHLAVLHLALRTGEETSALDEQRRNLVLVHQTAGEIRQLIDKLPPAEQVNLTLQPRSSAAGRES